MKPCQPCTAKTRATHEPVHCQRSLHPQVEPGETSDADLHAITTLNAGTFSNTEQALPCSIFSSSNLGNNSCCMIVQRVRVHRRQGSILYGHLKGQRWSLQKRHRLRPSFRDATAPSRIRIMRWEDGPARGRPSRRNDGKSRVFETSLFCPEGGAVVCEM